MSKGRVPDSWRLRDAIQAFGAKAARMALAPMMVLSMLPAQALPELGDELAPSEETAISTLIEDLDEPEVVLETDDATVPVVVEEEVEGEEVDLFALPPTINLPSELPEVVVPPIGFPQGIEPPIFDLNGDEGLEEPEADLYCVTYDVAGGWSEIKDPNQYEEGDTVEVIFSPTPLKFGFDFVGWAVTEDATEAVYTEDGVTSFELEGDVTLYAVWVEGEDAPVIIVPLVSGIYLSVPPNTDEWDASIWSQVHSSILNSSQYPYSLDALGFIGADVVGSTYASISDNTHLSFMVFNPDTGMLYVFIFSKNNSQSPSTMTATWGDSSGAHSETNAPVWAYDYPNNQSRSYRVFGFFCPDGLPDYIHLVGQGPGGGNNINTPDLEFIQITAPIKEVVYDGDAHGFMPASTNIPGATITYEVETSAGVWSWVPFTQVTSTYTEVGEYSLSVRALASGFTTYAYNTCILRIIPRPITVKPVDESHTYFNGIDLVANSVEISVSSLYPLAPGHYLDTSLVEFDGHQDSVGQSASSIKDPTKIIIRDQNGVDVTSNYEINVEEGLLTVTDGYTVVYDPGTQGTWLADDETTIYLIENSSIPSFGKSGADTDVDHQPGYVFVGWDPDPLGSPYNGFIPDDPSNSLLTFVAQWDAIDYSVTYDANGGTGAPTDNDTYNVDDTVTVLADEPTRDGYTFGGWLYGGHTYEGGDTFVMPADDVTLVAQWDAADFIVTFNPNGGDTPSPTSKTVTFNSEYGTLATVSRDGYTFLGWFTSQTGGDEVTASTIVTTPNNHILYAHWSADEQTLYYDGNGADSGVLPSETHLTDEVFNLAANTFTREGYLFVGWAISPTGTVAYMNQESFTMPPYSTTLYAVWGAIDYTVTFDPNGGVGTPTVRLYNHVGDTIPVINAPVRLGYVFAGWLYNGTIYNPSQTFIMPAHDVTLVAQWTPIPYSVYYNLMGGGGGIPIDLNSPYNYGETVTIIPFIPTRAGYTFIGWALTPTGTGTLYLPGNSFIIYNDTYLYAVWTANVVPPTPITTYTVTYDPGAQGTFAPQTTAGLALGAATPAAPTPTGQPGYVFAGWSPTVAATVTGNVTYTAQWEEDLVIVRFVDYNGRLIEQQSVPRGGDATAPADPTRDGWSFTGWDGSFTDVSEDTTVTATYEQDALPPEPIVNVEPPIIPEAPGGAWALVNLILTVLGVIVGLWFFISYFTGKQEHKQNPRRKRRFAFRIVNILAAIAAIIVFILTENMRLPMVMVDIWTIVHVIIAILQIILTVLAVTWKRQQSSDETQSEYSGAPAK